MVVDIEYDADGIGHIVVEDERGRHYIDDQADKFYSQIGEVWWIRPNY